ncbi:hypothetical protein LB467_16500 [Salegentibacter sp. JZCK2]|uniref:hypothetical protein n=1 Tax=Salegentibacter tibetensis TaxID=2873600 RepID=UPI001CCA7B95|nr:hypothetical protein [Salegentibacter tibetensis]MBZ9731292.1 hypothetical protein [Salegentibacter tibetensis]
MLDEKVLKKLKRGVWIYFFLLIFEGALRKWVLPGLSEPLLLIRDPLALWLLFKAYQQGVWKPNVYVLIIWGVSILAFSLALVLGHGNIMVAIFGIRITLIQFPIIFLIGSVFTKKDVLQLGEVLLWMNIGMTLLVAFQFFSPQSAFINRGVGGDLEGSGFGGAAGFFRVPGTFSFTNGLAFFYGLAAAYIFYFWVSKYGGKGFRILLLISTIALLAAIPLSISRTVLFQIIITIIFLLVISGRNIKMLPRLTIAIVAVGLLLSTMKDISFFKTANKAFTERLTTANEIEGGMEGVVVDRFLGGMYGAIKDESFPFWGMGLGMGTNAGAKILTGKRGDGVFLISEAEWGRVIGEMGVILGFTFIALRVSLIILFFKKSWKVLSTGNKLPWMLLSFGMFIILQGQWAQPTTLGFSVLIGGLILASLRNK